MEKLICVYCSKSNNVVWASLKSFVVSWLEGEPKSIILYYECPSCGSLFSTSIPVTQER